MRRYESPPNWWSPFEYHPDALFALLDHKRSGWRYNLWLGLNGDTNEPMVAEKDSPLLVIGPPGSNKSAGVMIPNALLAPGALFCVSSRADIYKATARARARLGTVWHFSAYGNTVPGAQPVKFSILQGCEDETAADKIALRVASWVDRSEYAQQTMQRGHLHFRNHAHGLLFGLFLIAANTDRDMGWVHKTVTSPAFTKTLVNLTRELESHPALDKLSAALDTLAWIASISPEERGSALSTAAHAVSAYRDAKVVEHSIGADFDFDRFVRGDAEKMIKGARGFDNGVLGNHGVWPFVRGTYDSLYVTDASAESPAAIIYSEFEFRVREAIYKLSLERELAGAAKPMPVTILNDEGAVAPPMQLSYLLAEMRDRGVMFAMAIQSLSQARTIFGQLGEDFLTLFRTALVFRGIKDKATLELLSMLSGRYWQDITSRSTNQGPGNYSTGNSTGPQLVEQLREDQIAKGHPMWPDGALVLNSLAQSYWVRGVPYFCGEPWPRLLIRHLTGSIRDESLLPLPRLEADYLDELGLTQPFHDLTNIWTQYAERNNHV
jgi:type IV secretion system protein VirD4